MPIDTEVARSPGWWLVQLEKRLRARTAGTWNDGNPGTIEMTQMFTPAGGLRHSGRRRVGRPGLDCLDDYLRGDPPLPLVAEEWADVMRPFLRQARMNYAELVVEAVRERMIPLGYTTAIDADENGDQVAARISAANELDLQLADTFRRMLCMADAYMILGKEPGADDDAVPLITAEDPRNVITAEDPATRRTLAALKIYRDEWDDLDVAYVYLPGEVWRATRGGDGASSTIGQGWEWDEATPQAWPAGFEDFIPVVRFRNRDGLGEFEPHLDVLDRINDGIFTRVAIAKYQAFRQRAVKNLPARDETGKEIDYSEMFVADPGAFWQVPENVDFWESQPIDLGPIRLATRDDVEGLAAVTRTPMYFITPDAAAGSAEGASTQREGLVYRTEDRRRRADAGLAKLMAGAFRMMGEADRADVLSIHTLWQPAERFSLGERANAAAQAKAGGLPTRRIWTMVWQLKPEDIPALEREEAEDLQRDAERAALLEQSAGASVAGRSAAASAPAPAAVPPGPAGPPVA